MKITEEDVKKIANKAKLRLTENEVKKYQGELESILEFIDKINEVDTEGVVPTYQVHNTSNVFREDKVDDCGDKIKDKIIENFPDKVDRLLKIPPVF